MNWKEQIFNYEKEFGFHKKKDWNPGIRLVNKFLDQYPDDVEINIRSLYFFHNILVEEEYPKGDHEYLSNLLKKYFNQSYAIFSNNPEYLFFMGNILHIAEWYFGLNNESNSLEENLAFEMQKRAFEIEPKNLLYEWSYTFTKNEKKRAFVLSDKILHSDPYYVNWLRTKGFPGKYIIESLNYCYNNVFPDGADL